MRAPRAQEIPLREGGKPADSLRADRSGEGDECERFDRGRDERAKAERKHRFLYAYPSVDNAPSNAICRKLGFTLVDVSEYEYPKDSGKIMRCNDWRLDLFAGA